MGIMQSMQSKKVIKQSKDASLKDVTGTDHEKLVGFILQREASMQIHKSEHKTRFEEAERQINAHLNEDKYNCMFSFKAVRDFSQKMQLPSFKFRHKKKEDELATIILDEALSSDLQITNFDAQAKKSATNQSAYGESYMMMHYAASDWDGLTGVACESLTPLQVLIDETHTQFLSDHMFGDANDIIIKRTYSMEPYLKHLKESKGNWINLDKVEPGFIGGDSSTINQISPQNVIEVWWYYNRAKDLQLIIAGGGNTVIKDTVLPTRIGKKKVLPLVQFGFQEIIGSPRFQGLPAILKVKEDMKNLISRMFIDNAFDVAQPTTFIDVSNGGDKEVVAKFERRERIIPIQRSILSAGKDIVSQHKVQGLSSDVLTFMSSMDQEAISDSAVDTQRLTRESKHASTELLRDEYINSVIKSIVEKNERSAWRHFVRIYAYMMIDNYSKDKWRELLPKDLYDRLVSNKENLSIKRYLSKHLQSTDLQVDVGTSLSPTKAADIETRKQAIQ